MRITSTGINLTSFIDLIYFLRHKTMWIAPRGSYCGGRAGRHKSSTDPAIYKFCCHIASLKLPESISNGLEYTDPVFPLHPLRKYT